MPDPVMEMSRKPSWSPNSTYLHLDFLCQHTKKKTKQGNLLPDPQNIPTKMVNTRKTMENHQRCIRNHFWHITSGASPLASGASPLAHLEGPKGSRGKRIREKLKIALLGFFADIQKFSCLCAWNLMVVIILQPDRQIETIFFSIVTILMPIDARNQFIGKMGPTFCSFSFLSLFTFHRTLSNFSFFHGFFIFWPLVSQSSTTIEAIYWSISFSSSLFWVPWSLFHSL